jgi:hypothetical protein
MYFQIRGKETQVVSSCAETEKKKTSCRVPDLNAIPVGALNPISTGPKHVEGFKKNPSLQFCS